MNLRPLVIGLLALSAGGLGCEQGTDDRSSTPPPAATAGAGTTPSAAAPGAADAGATANVNAAATPADDQDARETRLVKLKLPAMV